MNSTRPLTTFSRLILRQTPLSRPLSTTAVSLAQTRNPSDQRDAQDDRKSMNTEPNEYAKSGTDAATAGQEEAAFNTNNPDPQDAKKKAGEGTQQNPLDASPANPEISKGTSEAAGGGGSKKK